ncbi:MAG: hypothetical protein Q4B85_04570 [Lachnospiraceae bacterium]|nr:hypothetical protein [Lachnospiraceae bacterium]
MGGKSPFMKKIKELVQDIDPELLSYNEEEFWLYERYYDYVKRYAAERKLYATAVALPLVRGLHNGIYRKSSVVKDGISYRLPYVIHCLKVCCTLIDLRLPLEPEDEDTVLATALCHDLIEDIPFPNGGRELYTDYHLTPAIYETVLTLSKRRDFTEEEHRAYFQKIQENPLALLVKLADRGNNVEDLYNMSIWKVHEYVQETKECIFPMCAYARKHYPHIISSFTILQDKMKNLCEIAEILVGRYEEQEKQMTSKLERLKEENLKLRHKMLELQL